MDKAVRSLAIAVAAVLAGVTVPRAAATVPNPSVTGPTSGGARGQPFGALPASYLAARNYTEAEYFVSGTATAYDKAGTLGVDGVWPVKPARTADYKVRMLVRRPADPRRFNGILVVEWLNV